MAWSLRWNEKEEVGCVLRPPPHPHPSFSLLPGCEHSVTSHLLPPHNRLYLWMVGPNKPFTKLFLSGALSQ